MVLEILGYSGIKILAIISEIVNIGLLSGLLYIYIKSYRKIKFGFTVGLILFALMLLFKSIMGMGFILFSNQMPINFPYILGNIVQIIALLILLKISNL
ncbi:hypothetical protein [Methanobacterium sp.]|jgi:hypothetical protein|uniref:hypothetical protein n=1 Tax=Methanobacterium sp. TaxID=2164 RepID=UPI0031587D9B